MSPRMARPVFGLGLLEAISENTLLDLEVAQMNEGIVSGRINRVWDVESSSTKVGRFGWKANEPTVKQQSADAYHSDMGITSPLSSIESVHGTDADDGFADDPEISDEILSSVAFYIQTLGVPSARGIGDPVVEGGRLLFKQAGCTGCHVPQLRTGELEGVPEVSNQDIFPYTDLLLHDMGDGLADGRRDFLADGQEWRTAPLWGIGLTMLVNQHTFLLHDGRARDVNEAILWHGGEAEYSKTAYLNMSSEERVILLTFINSL